MIEYLQGVFGSELGLVRNALFAGLLASVAFGMVGTYVVTRRITYIAGAIAHCVLGGIGGALYLQRVVGIGWMQPMLGALVAAVASALIIGTVSLVASEREDTVIGALWATGMALGVIFMDLTPGYVDLGAYLFGDIQLIKVGAIDWSVSSWFENDLLLIGLLDVVVVGCAVLFYNRFLAVCFDEEFAGLRGVRTRWWYFLLLLLAALTVVLLVSIVGIIMVIALLTIPAAIAGMAARRLWQMMALAVVLSMGFTTGGLILADLRNLPSGPVIILLAAGGYIVVLVGRAAWRAVSQASRNSA